MDDQTQTTQTNAEAAKALEEMIGGLESQIVEAQNEVAAEADNTMEAMDRAEADLTTEVAQLKEELGQKTAVEIARSLKEQRAQSGDDKLSFYNS